MKYFLRILTVMLLSAFVMFPHQASGETAKLDMKFLTDASWDESADDFLLRLTNSVNFAYYGQGSRQQSSTEFAQIVEKEPEYKCKTPLKGVISVGCYKYAAALDSSDLAENGYDRLIIDLNRNGDISDDNVIKANEPEYRFKGTYKNNEFPVVKIKSQADGEEYDYAFLLEVDSTVDRDKNIVRAGAHIKPMAYRVGTIMIGGKEHRIHLLDFNGNGFYNDLCKLLAPNPSPDHRKVGVTHGDALFVDMDMENKEFHSHELFARPERRYISDLINIDGNYYKLKIKSSGSEITITEAAIPVGYIFNDSEEFVLSIFDEANDRWLKLFGKAGENIPVPAGAWQLYRYYIVTSEKENKDTNVAAIGTYDFVPVEVKAGDTVSFTFGEEYVLKVTVGRYSGNEATLQLEIKDKAGGICTELTIDGEQPDSPRFIISTKDGNVAHTGTFKIKRQLIGRYIWNVPQKPEDEYHMSVQMNMGPFKVDDKTPLLLMLFE